MPVQRAYRGPARAAQHGGRLAHGPRAAGPAHGGPVGAGASNIARAGGSAGRWLRVSAARASGNGREEVQIAMAREGITFDRQTQEAAEPAAPSVAG